MTDEFEKLITDIPEHVKENTVIETYYNDGYSVVEFHNADLSLEADQEKMYSFQFATMDCDKDEYYDKQRDSFGATWLVGYNTPEEAEVGHYNIIRYIRKHGMSHLCFDDDRWKQIAAGRLK